MKPDFEAYLDEDGHILLEEGQTLVDYLDMNAAENADKLAYRFLDYKKGEHAVEEITWRQFHARLKAIAARLQQVAKPGDRVATLAPQGLDYVTAFFAACYAGCISVPLFDPAEPGHTDRLHAVLGDCKPAAILTSTSAAEGVRRFFRSLPAKERPRIIAVDAVPDEVGATFERRPAKLDDIAYLQYTSGSTRVPAGVEITHRAVGTNVLQILDSLDLDLNCRGVTWLPMFHDMGLVTVIVPALGGRYITIMSPAAFVRRPSRWIRELAAESDGAGTFSAAPNFAFEHAAARGLPKDGEPLDLSNIRGLINGSEPVTVSSMKKFNDAFKPYGLSEKAIKPSYGMAEATLFVSSTNFDKAAKVIYVDREELAAGRVVEIDQSAPNAVAQVACGQVARSQWAVIVDPEACIELADGHIGEVWLHGNNMGVGYWGRDEETKRVFKAKLEKRLPDGSHAGELSDDTYWMRTGDFGCWYEGDLYITGRLKDLIIVDGRNHYPHDIEHSVGEATKAVRPGYVAAFSVPVNQLPAEVFAASNNGVTYDPNDASEQLIIVAERGVGAGKLEPGPIIDTVRATVAARHGVMVRDLLLVPAGSIPRTSSGKIAHRACRAAYIDGTLRGGYKQTAFPDAPDA